MSRVLFPLGRNGHFIVMFTCDITLSYILCDLPGQPALPTHAACVTSFCVQVK